MADLEGAKAVERKTAPAARPSAKPVKRVRPVEDRLHTWPFLTRSEFICAILCLVILTAWAILVQAPLEEPANPSQTPNPAKAPWYFLGLQEMLVYFDPWFAGVVLPTLIIVGLMLIPYLDINPKGSGYYTFRERWFAISTFLFGFLILWISLIIIGVLFRGPGWYLFWPWEKWDPHRTIAITNVDLPYWGPFRWPMELLGLPVNPKVKDIFLVGPFLVKMGFTNLGEVELLGGILTILYYSLGVAFWYWKKDKIETLRLLGPARYGIVAFLFLTMMGLPIKMFLRLFFNIKYVWVTPWFNI